MLMKLQTIGFITLFVSLNLASEIEASNKIESPDSLIDDSLKLDVVVVSRLRYTYKNLPEPERCQQFCLGLGQHVNELNGIPASGAKASLDTVTLNRVADILRRRQWPLGAKSLADHLDKCLKVVGSLPLLNPPADGGNKLEGQKSDEKQGAEQRLHDELDLLNDELARLRDENNKLQSQLGVQNNSQQQQSQATTTTAEVAGLKSELGVASGQVRECQSKLEANERRSQIEIKGRDDELAEMDKIVATLKRSLDDSERRAGQLKSQVAELQAAQGQVAAANELQLAGQSKALRDKIATLESQLNAATGRCGQSGQQVSALEVNLAKCEGENANQKRELADITNRLAEYEELSEKLFAEIEEKSKQMKIIELKKTACENDKVNSVAYLLEEVDDLRREVAAAKEEKQMMRDQLVKLEEANKSCEGRAAKPDPSSYEEYKRLMQKWDNCNNQLTTCEINLKTLNFELKQSNGKNPMLNINNLNPFMRRH